MRRSGVVLLLTDSTGRIAFQERDDAVLADGTPLWGLFGGWMEPDERPDAAAIREVREELGCVLDPNLLRAVDVRTWSVNGAEVECHIYAYPVRTELNNAALTEGLSWEFRALETLRGRLLPHHEEIASSFVAGLAR